MNWIERMYELKGKDLYSQNGEGLILDYILYSLKMGNHNVCVDIGGGDGFYLSNTRHLRLLGNDQIIFDLENGYKIIVSDVHKLIYPYRPNLLSIDIDGNDYWILSALFNIHKPEVIIAEFNASYTDSRTIAYNPDHVWAGDSYYGFTFEAGKKLAEKHGYKVIFQVANMNMIMVREDLIKVSIPPVTYEKSDYFKMSGRTDWIFI